MKIIDPGAQDFGVITALLEAEQLPVSDLTTVNWFSLLGIRIEDQLIAVGGLELCGYYLLLRSVVIAPAHRGNGVGARIVEALHLKAKQSGYQAVYLLTMDAQPYFQNIFNYRIIERTDAPTDITLSSQFRETCPGDASLMKVSL